MLGANDGKKWTGAVHLANHMESSVGQRQVVEVVNGKPARAIRIVAGAQRAATDLAQVVDQNVMIFCISIGIRHDALENERHLNRNNFEAGLFANFARDSVFETLARLDGAAW